MKRSSEGNRGRKADVKNKYFKEEIRLFMCHLMSVFLMRNHQQEALLLVIVFMLSNSLPKSHFFALIFLQG